MPTSKANEGDDMSLNNEQEEMQAAIKKSATITGSIWGAIGGLISLWVLGGQSTIIWLGGSIVIAALIGFGIFKWRYGANSDSAKCEKCGASYSIERTNKSEALLDSTPKEEREEQEDGSTKVTTWTEERINVTETYSCSKCEDTTTKEYESSRRKDIKDEIVAKSPAEKAMEQKLERGAKSGGMSRPAPEKPKSGQGRKSK